MGIFENKYGVKEDEKVEVFHRNRRMFCIFKNKLYIAEPNIPYSHAVWFKKEGWLSKEDEKIMDNIVRGLVDDKGNIYFYVGYDFHINKEIELIFFSHLKELVEKLDIDPNAKIYGGAIKQKPGGRWPPRKSYGNIKENLKS